MHQFFAPLAEPIGALWGLMMLGVFWLLFRRQWRSAFWLGLPTAVLFVFGSTPLPEILVAREERQWVANEQAESGKWKVESGITSGHTSSGLRPPSPQGGEGRGAEGGPMKQQIERLTGQGKSEIRNPKLFMMPSSPWAAGSGFRNTICWGLPRATARAASSRRFSWCVRAKPKRWYWVAVGQCQAGQTCPK